MPYFSKALFHLCIRAACPTDAAACLMGISLGWASTPITLRPRPIAPEDTIRTSTPLSLSSLTWEAMLSRNFIDSSGEFLAMEDVPTFTTTRSTSPNSSFLSLKEDTSCHF